MYAFLPADLMTSGERYSAVPTKDAGAEWNLSCCKLERYQHQRFMGKSKAHACMSSHTFTLIWLNRRLPIAADFCQLMSLLGHQNSFSVFSSWKQQYLADFQFYYTPWHDQILWLWAEAFDSLHRTWAHSAASYPLMQFPTRRLKQLILLVFGTCKNGRYTQTNRIWLYNTQLRMNEAGDMVSSASQPVTHLSVQVVKRNHDLLEVPPAAMLSKVIAWNLTITSLTFCRAT